MCERAFRSFYFTNNFVEQSMKTNPTTSTAGLNIHRVTPSAMDVMAQQQLHTLLQTSQSKRLWTWQPYSANPLVMSLCEEAGISHHEQDLRGDSTIVIPPHGAPALLKKQWKSEGRNVIDLSTPETRRAQTALGLMKLEGAQLVIIGRKDDPEVISWIHDHRSTRVVEHAEDAVRIPFAPAYGIVCQTSFCPNLARHFTSVIANRHRDSRVTFLDTSSPEENRRRQALAQASRIPGPLLLLGHSHATEMMAHAAAELRLNTHRVSPRNPLAGLNLHSTRNITIAASSDVLPQEIEELIARVQHKQQSQTDPRAA